MNTPADLCSELCSSQSELVAALVTVLLALAREWQWRRRQYRWSLRPPAAEQSRAELEPFERPTEPRGPGLRRRWTCPAGHEWSGRLTDYKGPPECPVCGAEPDRETAERQGPD
jgi:hypothetical protein